MTEETNWKAGDQARILRGLGEGEICTLLEDLFFNWVLVEHEGGIVLPRCLDSLEPISQTS